MINYKVVFVVPQLGSGGAERVVSILAKGFVKEGLSVDVLLLWGDQVQYEIPNEVTIYKSFCKGVSLLERINRIHKFLKEQKKIYNVVVIPFLDSCNKSVLMATIGTGIPVIVSERNNPYIRKGILSHLIPNLLFLMSDYCVFQTPDARKYYFLVKDSKCKIIINPIQPTDIRWNGILTPDKLVSVCRLHKQKNIPMLLDAINILKSQYSDVHIDIYGEGPLENEIRKLIIEKKLLDNVSLCGITKNINEVLSRHSVFISSSDYEGISNSMLEAMSVGMPIVCTDCPIGGVSMMLKEDCGVLTPVNNADLLAQSIIGVLKDYSHSCKMANNAHKKALLYMPSKITKQWLDIVRMISI